MRLQRLTVIDYGIVIIIIVLFLLLLLFFGECGCSVLWVRVPWDEYAALQLTGLGLTREEGHKSDDDPHDDDDGGGDGGGVLAFFGPAKLDHQKE